MSDFKLMKKSGGNRRSLDIVKDILIVASVSVRKTRIMYQANLSYVQVNKYLNKLLTQGLLKHEDNSRYLITDKGLAFLKLYEEYVERCTKLKEQVSQSVKDRLHLERIWLVKDFNG